MIGFRITINDSAFCESDDLTAFTMVVEDLRSPGEQRVSLHAQAGDGPLQWLAAHLKVGDSVQIDVVDLLAENESQNVDLACGFCGLDTHAVTNLIQGQSASICDLCTVTFSEAVGGGGRLPTGAAFRDEPEWACGFCSRAATALAGVVVRNGAAICPECLSACRDLVRGNGTGE